MRKSIWVMVMAMVCVSYGMLSTNFDDNTVQGWYGENDMVNTISRATGGYALQIGIGGTGSMYASVDFTHTVSAGDTISFDYGCAAGHAGDTVPPNFTLYSPSGDKSQTLSIIGPYTSYSAVLTDLGFGVGDVITGMKYGIWSGTANAAYIDEVVITPEPATMALLGIGGLLLGRRKRA